MLGAFSVEAMGAEHEIDYSLQSGAKVKNIWNYTAASARVLIVFCLISAETDVIFPSSKCVM
jgi:hypothetical protein